MSFKRTRTGLPKTRLERKQELMHALMHARTPDGFISQAHLARNSDLSGDYFHDLMQDLIREGKVIKTTRSTREGPRIYLKAAERTT